MSPKQKPLNGDLAATSYTDIVSYRDDKKIFIKADQFSGRSNPENKVVDITISPKQS